MQQTDRSDFEGFQSPKEREKIIIIIIKIARFIHLVSIFAAKNI
jgi:hypothetical protein